MSSLSVLWGTELIIWQLEGTYTCEVHDRAYQGVHLVSIEQQRQTREHLSELQEDAESGNYVPWVPSQISLMQHTYLLPSHATLLTCHLQNMYRYPRHTKQTMRHL